MKKLLLSITAAIFLHAAFLSADFSSLQLFPSATPDLNSVTMTLMAYAPPDRSEKPPPVGHQTVDPQIDEPIEQPEATLPAAEPVIPPETIAEPPPKEDQTPILPEPEVEPDHSPPPEPEPETEVKPVQTKVPELPPEPTESTAEVDQTSLLPESEIEPDHSPPPEPEPAAEVKPVETTVPKQPLEPAKSIAERDADEPADTFQKWQKPKRSMKARTKVTTFAAVHKPSSNKSQKPAKVSQKESRSSKAPDQIRTKPEAGGPAGSPTDKSTTREMSTLPAALEDAANAVASVNKTVRAPKIIMARPLYRRNPPPNYPKRAQRGGLEGVVILDVRVNEDGEVEDLEVFQSSGHKILDRAAVKSVKKWLFQPGTRNGQKIETQVHVPVRFRLQ